MSTCAGRLLRVDLTTRAVTIEQIPEQTKRDFVGGRGFGIRYLFDELKPGIDPLGPENKLILLTGVLAGTSAQGFSKWMAMTKSPLTGCVGRSVGGGNFGAALKFAGFDLVIVEGRSETPVYVHAQSDGVRVLDARDLWGLDTERTQQVLRSVHGANAQIACIGPAGEKLVRYATITHGRRTASRCGVGTVMGAKNLKAVAVNAAGQITPDDPIAFQRAVQTQVKMLKTHPRRVKMTTSGTTSLVEVADRLGCFPTRNFQAGRFEGIEAFLPAHFAGMKTKNFGCYSCMTRCGQVHVVAEGQYAGAFSEGPEYETIWAFGGQVGNADLGAVIAAEAACDLLGLDTISTGNCIGFACELFEKGIINTREADDLDLSWGNHPAFLKLVQKIADREGFGTLLGEGVKRAAERIGRGAHRYAMHAKGLELPAYEPRAIKGYGLSYATSNIGGSHMYGRPRQEIYGTPDPRPVDRLADEGKGDIIALVQKQQAAEEVIVRCTFGNSGLSADLLRDLLISATGNRELGDAAHLEQVGERIVCLERAFNVREGLDRKNDTLPQRMLTEPLQNAGSATGEVIRKLDSMLDEYYNALGYTHDGIPSRGKMLELGMLDVANEIAVGCLDEGRLQDASGSSGAVSGHAKERHSRQ